MSTSSWEARARRELAQAEEAKLKGNEGMARVCARRAAGIIAGEYLGRLSITTDDASAYNRLRVLSARPELRDELREAVSHLLLRVTPEHTLPVEADLLSDARLLAFELLDVDLK